MMIVWAPGCGGIREWYRPRALPLPETFALRLGPAHR